MAIVSPLSAPLSTSEMIISRAMKLRTAAALALLASLTACSSAKRAVSEDFRLCRKGACKSGGGTRAELARAVYALMQSAAGRDLVLSEEKPGAAVSRGRGIRVFTQGGPIPAVYRGRALHVTEVSYLDMAEGAVKFKGRMRGTFLFVPVHCSEGEGAVRILSDREARLEFSNVCTWLGPTSFWKLDGNIDRVDVDGGVLGFFYHLRGGGVPVMGGGSGYLLAGVAGRAAEPSGRAGAEPGLAARLQDADGDSILAAGEAFTLTVELANTGAETMKNVRLRFSGSPALTALLGAERLLGDLPAGEATSSQVRGTIPLSAPAESADLRVEAVRDPGGVLVGAKAFQVDLGGRVGAR